MLIILSLLVLVFLFKTVQVYKFLKLISRFCYIYDRNYINEHGDEDISIILDYTKEKYHLTAEWSAYNWMFFKGPNPYMMVFLLKPLTVEIQYGKEVMSKLRKYYVFEDYEWEKENK